MWPFNKKKKIIHSTFPGFKYHAGQLSAYLHYRQYFIIALKEQEDVIRYCPTDATAFHDWLKENKIRDVNG